MPDDIAPPLPLQALAEASPPPQPIPLPAHAPLLLDDPSIRWIVAAGTVTLFAALPPRPPATEGPRRYIGTIRAGGMICGVGTALTGASLLAVGGADTRLLPLPEGEEAAPRLAAALEGWAQALASGLARPMSPRPRVDIPVSGGMGTLYPPAGLVIAARGAPAWARINGDGWLLLGLEPVRGLLPLPAGSWLVSGKGSIQPLAAEVALADPEWEPGLAALNDALLDALPAALALDAADELNRRRLREERDEEAGADGRAAFAAILGNPVERPEPANADPLMPVFRAVAAHFGLRARRLVRVRSTDVDASSSLEELARASGLRLRPAHLEGNWWEEDQGPLFVTRPDGATVGLLPDGRGHRLVTPERPGGARLDPATARTLSREAQAPILPLPRKSLTLSDLVGAGMRRAGGDVAAIFVTMLIGAALGQAVPLATGVAFTLLIPGGHLPELAQLGLAMALVAAVAWATRLGGEIARQRIEARAGPALHAAIWDRVIRLPLSILSRQTVGETAGRAASAISLAAQLRAFSFAAISAVSVILSAGTLMLLSQPLAAAIGLGLLLLQILAANLAGWLQARAFASGEALSGLADAMVFQIVSGLVKLRLAGAEHRAGAVWAARFAGMRARLAAARRVGNGYDAFAAGFAVLSTAAAFLVIALLQRVEPGQPPPSISSVMTFLSAYGLMAGSGTQLAKTVFSLWFLMPTRRFAQPLLESLPESEGGRVDPGRLSGALELSNLAFRYGPADPWIFSGLSLRVEPGEFVAIVGRSGAGKSTLVRLLLGLEQPASGAIFMDGHDIRGLDLGVLRQQVATVLQSGRVPPGSIRDAVRGLTPANDAAVWAALESAALAADIRAMPMGLETVLTDASRVLSGGQAQRLLLARALLQKPALMILDEATSALDNVTQRATMRAIRTVSATRLVIAHRLSTIRHADRIIVLDSGRIAESGSFDDLIRRKDGLFARQFAEEARWQAAAGPARRSRQPPGAPPPGPPPGG
ncbi:ATP-binding cassette domain-containing protein [Roseomonas populi]|uniref:ATP-binding cassette domain-containing protein n=1 Tax=Roseomonas populi TaxID=3121582 RepID=A0ABT1X5I7_9PROT|nr:ATP-binding cassette domain-containing protein [Roseomonas pecuniae]MCR0983365.1 ATP-binding cassette domain-containing protein [Roseomonas pecuniae]